MIEEKFANAIVDLTNNYIAESENSVNEEIDMYTKSNVKYLNLLEKIFFFDPIVIIVSLFYNHIPNIELFISLNFIVCIILKLMMQKKFLKKTKSQSEYFKNKNTISLKTYTKNIKLVCDECCDIPEFSFSVYKIKKEKKKNEQSGN